jgi:hypothetical protein
LREAETRETLWVPQPLAPLRGQGGAWSGELWLCRHPPLQHVLGFLPSGHAAAGWQAQGHARGLLGLAPPPCLGHPQERCDGIGTDRHADVIAPEGRGGRALEVQRGANLLTQSARGPGGKQRFTLGAGGVREPWGFAQRLARQQA